MGYLYRPKLKSGAQSSIWWCKYYLNGRPVRESTGVSADTKTAPQAARQFLKQREGAAATGQPISPRADRVQVDELLNDLQTDYTVNERRSAERLEFSLAHLRPVFGARRAHQVGPADVRMYVASRLEAGAAPATINRELAALRRAFTLGVDGQKIHWAPKVQDLDEHNVRQGFFEFEAFEAVRRHLRAPLRPVVLFAYVTGWRIKDEVLPLTWRQVDFKAGTVRLEPGTTKNDEGRMFVMTPELRAGLESQRALTEALQRKTGRIIPFVFHRNGKPIKDYRGTWRTACTAAGTPGRIPHDFRRTAVRNLERAGVSRSVAMKMTGHKTEAVYRRYAIVSEQDLHEAARKLAALGTFAGTSGPESDGLRPVNMR